MNTHKIPAPLAAIIAALAFFSGCDNESPGAALEDELELPLGPPKPPRQWTQVGLATQYIAINKIAYGNGLFVACGNNNTPEYHSYACYSADGITWTEAVNYEPVFSTDNMHVFYGNGWFIAHPSASQNTHWGKSQNGRDWTSIGNTNSYQYFNAKGGVYANGYWVVAGSGGRISHSRDTTTWTKPLEREYTTFRNPAGGPKTYINALAYGKGKFVAGGGTGHIGYAALPGGPWYSTPKSADPAELYPNWEHGGELVELIFDKGFINAIVFAKDKGRFVAVGGLDVGGTGKAAYSDDGVNWIQSGSIAPVGRGCKVTCVAYGAGVFVLADNAGKAAWSEDGVTWTPVDDTTFNDKDDVIQTICYGNGVWVMAGYYGKLAYSIPE